VGRATWTQSNFNSGEWSPLAYGRFDIGKYGNGLGTCQNYLPTQQGGLTRRPGFRYVSPVKNSAAPPRLQAFQFSITQAYILEFGDSYIRVYVNDGQLLSGGVAYEIATTYNATDVWLLNFTQSADTLFITHPSKPPRKLQRAAATTWNLTDCSFLDGPYLSVNTSSTTLTPSQTAATGGSASFATNVMTVTVAPTAGAMSVGHQVKANGVVEGTTIDALLSGTLGAIGSTYRLSTSPGTISAESFSTVTPLVGGWTVTVTASAVAGINSDAGFRASDVGRKLRIKCGGVWLWGNILAVTDSTHVQWGILATYNNQLPVTATATANISGGSVFTVSIVNGGSGYGVTPPTVTFSGGGGSGAVAYALLTNGVVSSITMSVTGTGYTSAPTVTLSPPTGVVASSTTFWRLGLWNATDGYPSCVTFHQDRLCFAGAANSPSRVDCSNTGDYLNFAPTNQDGTVVDSSALGLTLNSGLVNAISWLSSDQWGLIIGTAGDEWVISPSSTQQAITPTNLNAFRLSNYGSAAVAPLRVGRANLFVQRTGRKLREMTYDFMVQTFKALDISLIAEHLTKSGLKQMALQLAPQQVVWIARQDGNLTGMTYDKDQEICGWHRHILGGFSDLAQTVPPKIISVASIPDPTITRDEVWAVVQRSVNGQTVCSVEVSSKLWEDGDDLAGCNFLDCSAGQTFGSPVTTVNIPWLAGQTVGVLTDGAVHPEVVVASNGDVALQWQATTVQVGLPYTSLARTLSIEAGGQDGPAQGKLKRVFRTIIRFFQSIGLNMGSSLGDGEVVSQAFRSSADLMNQPVGLFSGDKRWSYEGTQETAATVYFSTSDPLPSNITLLVAQLETEDGR
jgi:hypothetical protein